MCEALAEVEAADDAENERREREEDGGGRHQAEELQQRPGNRL